MSGGPQEIQTLEAVWLSESEHDDHFIVPVALDHFTTDFAAIREFLPGRSGPWDLIFPPLSSTTQWWIRGGGENRPVSGIGNSRVSS